MRITIPGINTAGNASGGRLVLKGVLVVDTRIGELKPGRAVLIRTATPFSTENK